MTVMKKFITVILILLISAILGPAVQTFSQSLTPQERAKLQTEYDALQKEIADWQKVLDETKAKKNTLQGDVTILNAQIAKAEKEIKQRNITVTTLTKEINQKAANINSLEAQIENDKKLLGNLLKKKDQNEMEPIYYLLFSARDISGLIADLDAIDSVNHGLQDLFAELRQVKAETEKEKNTLAVKKNQELDAQYEVELKKKQISQNQAEKKQLLTFTTKAESNYEQVLAERQRRAEVIRSALFDLRDAAGISFAKALEYASYASEKTGVRTAMILAILSQESDLGKNIGSCYVSDLTTGDGVGKNTGTRFERVMYAPLPGSTSNRPNDTAVFAELTKSLGLNWATTPVSCPLGVTYYVGRGFGGAMGPSQFIPSTWQGFIGRLRSALGVSLPNPWDPKHAIMATSMYLSDLGAGGGTYTAERNAACKYYSGRACDNAKPYNTSYGNSVITKAEKFQADIDFLKNI
jgi:peptidoglycan hydrolase CwlO-like protein